MDQPSTRARTVAATLVESAWLAAVVATPLLFNARSDRPFEEAKVLLLRSLAGVIVAGVVVWAVEAGRRAFVVGGRTLWRVPVVVPVLLLAGTYVISTTLSINPSVSFRGAYLRCQGTYTWLSYVAVFTAILLLMRRRDQIERLITLTVLSSLPVAMYGLLQQLDADPFQWDPGGDRHGRIVSTAGNPIFLSAFMIMVVPLTLARMIEHAMLASDRSGENQAPRSRVAHVGLAATYAVLLVLQLLTILFSQSVGPLLGLCVGLLLFGVVFAFQRRRRWWFATILAGATATAACIGVFNLPHTPLQRWRQVKYLGDLGRLAQLDTGTGKVRALIWEGTAQLLAADPLRDLIGYGPEMMASAYEPYYPSALLHYQSSTATPDRAHNETLDALVTMGVAGGLAQLLVYGTLFFHLLRWLGLMATPGQRRAFVGVVAGGAISGVVTPWVVDGSITFSAVGFAMGLSLGVVIYVLGAVVAQWHRTDASASPHQLLLLGLLAGLIAHFVEIHLGISVTATRLSFFTYAAVAVIVGLQVADDSSNAASNAKATSDGLLLQATIVGVGLIVLTSDFYRPGVRIIDQGIALPMLLASTWIGGTLLVVGESVLATRTNERWLHGLTIYAVASLGTWAAFALVYGMWNVAQPALKNLEPDSVRALAAHTMHGVTILYAAVLLSLVAPALLCWWRTLRGLTVASQSRRWRVPLWVALALGALVATRTNLDAAHADGVSRLGAFYEDHAQLAAAGLLYEEAARLQPSEETYAIRLASVRTAQARGVPGDTAPREAALTQAEAALQGAQTQHPLNPQPPRELARLHRLWAGLSADPTGRPQHLEQAEKSYALALRISPKNAALWREAATLSVERDELGKALAKLDRSAAADDHDAVTFRLRGDVYLQIGAFDAALADYETALQLAPESLRVWSGKALALGLLNRIDEAIVANLQASAIAPQDMITHRNLALLYQRTGRWALALREAQAALALAAPADQPALRRFIEGLHREQTVSNGT